MRIRLFWGLLAGRNRHIGYLVVKLNRNENADEGEHREPDERPPCPGFDEWFIDQLNVEVRFRHVTSS